MSKKHIKKPIRRKHIHTPWFPIQIVYIHYHKNAEMSRFFENGPVSGWLLPVNFWEASRHSEKEIVLGLPSLL